MLQGVKVVLAYSGGLDTSVCLKWFEQQGAQPFALYLDLGQGEPAEDVRVKALKIGAADAYVRDAKVEFAYKYVAPAIKGNDQVRFDVATASIAPDLTVVAPVRDWSMSRPEEMAYAEEHGIPVQTTKESPYSVDANLFGRSIEAGPLEDPDHEPTEDVYELTAAPEEAPDEPGYVTLGFEEGLPVNLDGEELPLVELIAELNRIVGAHGVGRVDMIEDRLVGIKSREIYECPAALTIIQAHRELETMTLTKDVLRFKAALDAFIAETQKTVTGTVRVKLYKGASTVAGRTAPRALYSKELATYDPNSAFDESAAAGFIALWGLPARQWADVNGGVEQSITAAK